MTGKRTELRRSSKPARQLWLPFEVKGELFASNSESGFPAMNMQLMEAVVERGNLHAALKQVVRNGGGPGMDGMTVKELQRDWDRNFSEASFGFRPRRSAHQAVLQSQKYLKQGCRWIVDIDLEKFFDRVNHDKLMSKVRERVADDRVIRLILGFLKSGIRDHDHIVETIEGTPQGGPLSPLLANLMLDQLDKELESRGHRFVRYADDLNIYVKSRRAGKRVLKSVGNYLISRMKLKVNESKSGVNLPWKSVFLGFSFTAKLKRKISEKAIKRLKIKVRETTFRTRGVHIGKIVEELRQYLLGWQAYFNFAEAKSILKEMDSWIRRRLRCYLWKQWGRSGYRELVKRGVSRDLAWNTAKSAHGPWRLSRSPGLAFALPVRYFTGLGLPRLYEKQA